jgi:hypothetical protein
MNSIVFTNLSVNEQETLRGGSGYTPSPYVVNNVTSGSSSSASQGQSQGQQGQQSLLGLFG